MDSQKPLAPARRDRRTSSPEQGSIGELIDFVAPDLGDGVPTWPPDAFAIAAFVLLQTGGYVRALEGCPPERPSSSRGESWTEWMRRVGLEWRRSFGTGRTRTRTLPTDAKGWWQLIINKRGLSSAEILSDVGVRVCDALLNVLAAADEACVGLGVPPIESAFEHFAAKNLWSGHGTKASTLCTSAIRARVRVLPKMHTPQIGCTLRSLTQNLGLYIARDVAPYWHQTSLTVPPPLNLLLIPWPERVYPAEFVPAPLPEKRIGYFTYSPSPWDDDRHDKVRDLVKVAKKMLGHVEGIVFPELAVHEDAWDRLLRWLGQDRLVRLMIGGVGAVGGGDGLGRNYAAVAALSDDAPIKYEQGKHHRWLLDRRQVFQYHLGGLLDGGRDWWEAIAIGKRSVEFLAMCPWLTLCVLICEDLARQDPVSDLLRTIGPNLIIALLMDGPQLASRWPARYATVLAEDPGSAVLTLSSIGMVERSCPPGQTPQRIVGMWKDSRSAASIPIELPPGYEAIALTISPEDASEWTADGRQSHESTTRLQLTGIHAIRRES